MSKWHITFTKRDGTRDVRRVWAMDRSGAITTARTMFGAVGSVSAVKIG